MVMDEILRGHPWLSHQVLQGWMHNGMLHNIEAMTGWWIMDAIFEMSIWGIGRLHAKKFESFFPYMKYQAVHSIYLSPWKNFETEKVHYRIGDILFVKQDEHMFQVSTFLLIFFISSLTFLKVFLRGINGFYVWNLWFWVTTELLLMQFDATTIWKGNKQEIN